MIKQQGELRIVIDPNTNEPYIIVSEYWFEDSDDPLLELLLKAQEDIEFMIQRRLNG